MRYRYLLALALVLLLAADLGWKAWSERPYIVTGIGKETQGGNGYLTTHYTLPGGGVGEWRTQLATADAVGAFRLNFWCWDKAEIGKKIPDCMRANWKARTSGY